MLRKCLTVAAVFAAITAGTAGVANAATPAPAFPHDGHHDGHHDGGPLGGIFNGDGLNLLGGNTFIDNRFNNRFRGTFWNRGGVILPYDQVVSSCGCSGDPVALGYQLVPASTVVVPVGAPVTGDGSCLALSQVNWGLSTWHRGGRFFRR